MTGSLVMRHVLRHSFYFMYRASLYFKRLTWDSRWTRERERDMERKQREKRRQGHHNETTWIGMWTPCTCISYFTCFPSPSSSSVSTKERKQYVVLYVQLPWEERLRGNIWRVWRVRERSLVVGRQLLLLETDSFLVPSFPRLHPLFAQTTLLITPLKSIPGTRVWFEV